MKIFILWIILIQVIFSCAPIEEPRPKQIDPEIQFDDSFTRQVIEILIGIDKGKQQELFDGFNAEYKKSPESIDTMFYYALTLKNREEAWSVFNQILTKEPEKYYGYLGKAIIETEWKVYDKAEANLNKASKFAPNHFLVNYFHANYYFKKNEYDKALEYMKRIQPRFQENIIVLNLYGLIYTKMEKYEEAERYFKKSNEMDNNQYTPHLYLGIIYERANKIEDSYNEYKKAVDIRSSSKEAMLNLAQTAEKLNKVEDAAQLYEKIIDQWPNEAGVYIKLVPLLEKINAEARLIKALEDSTRVLPDNSELRTKLAKIYFQKNNLSRAEEEFKNVAKIKGNSAEIYVWLGRIAKKKEDHKKAMENFILALKERPDDSDAKSEMEALKKRFKISETPITGRTLEQVLGNFSKYVLKSYKELLKERPKMKGKVAISITYDTNGNVTEVTFEKNTINDPVLEACIYGNALAMKFPAGSKGKVGYEMEFNPAK
ncbi:MAG: tetratricopeptide repeat protein [Deltaproteobacteria bacterium]|nr:tetratricopeptide repeat protein [Deltaproteobacteria bacterium]